MKKKIIVCLYVILFIVCFKLGFSYFYNEYIISKYDDGNYSISASPLFICNWFQSYVAHYNMGNIYYSNGNFEAAIDEYKKALEANPDEEKECSVRINLALAIIGTIAEDYSSEENLEDTVAKLKEARAVLLEEDCATESGDGHSETAEKLKREIDEILKALEREEQKQPNNGNNDPEDNPKKDDKDDAYEQNIKEHLQQQQNDSYKERKESLDLYKEYEQEFNFELDGKVW